MFLPLSIAFTPMVMAATTGQPVVIATEPYVLGPGESVSSVAQRLKISPEKLQQLNQFRTFSRPFANLSVGDEIDIPLVTPGPQAKNPAQPAAPATTRPGAKGDPGLFWQRDRSASLADDMSAFGAPQTSAQNGGSATGMARSAINGKVNDAASQWLSRFGTARLQLNVNDDFHLDGSALDLLVPLYDRPKEMLFTQLGARNKDSRNTLNFGLGVRTWQSDWMLGMNAFYDYDLTGDNRRMGMGLEAWRDYLKLSANNYFRLSDWHQSRDFDDYNERPANGYDLRAEAYLPAYPQLGGRLVYEQYRGDQVALFGKDNLQKDPYAVTMGINYTPVNLVTIGADFRQGKGSVSDTTINLQLNYRLGDSWQSQIDPAAVAATRTLAGTRYDLVDRNNDIVLEYQKQQVIRLRLPELLIGHAGDNGAITAQVTTKYGLDRIEWDTAALAAAGGSVSQVGQNVLAITFPPYKMNGGDANIYEISAIAFDIRNNSSNRATTRIEVQPAAAQLTAANLRLENSPARANNIDVINVSALVTDASGNPVAGQTVTFSASNNAVITTVIGTTGADGLATATLTSLTAGTSVVTATLNGNSRTVDATFIADSATAQVAEGNLIVVEDRAFANGSSTNKVEAIVTDAHGNRLAGQQVIFTATNDAVVTTVIGTTGPDGVASATLTSLKAGPSTVTAELASNHSSRQKDVTFIPDTDSARIAAGNLEIIHNDALANDSATNEVRARVTDANGNAIPGQKVTFTVASGAALVTVNDITDENGFATATLKSTKAGPIRVTATLDNRSTQFVDPVFHADPATASITLLNIDGPTSVIANGNDSIRVVATVTDAFGNPLVNQTVDFTNPPGGTAVFAPVNGGLTDDQGHAAVTLTNMVPGLSPVIATLRLNGSTKTVDTTFTLDTTTARIVLIQATTDNSPADGGTANTVMVEVRNAANQLLPGMEVTFTTTNNASPATVTLPTNGAGVATLNLISDTVGPSLVTARLDNGSTDAVNVTFTTNIFINSIAVPLNDATANGEEENEAVVHVVNAAGAAAGNVEVNLEAVGAAGTFRVTSPAGARTDANGNITIRYTYTLAETLTIRATAVDGDSMTNTDSRFTIPDIDVAIIVPAAAYGSGAVVSGTVTILSKVRRTPIGDTQINVQMMQTTTTDPTSPLSPFTAAVSPGNLITTPAGTANLSSTSAGPGENVYFIVTLLNVNEGNGNLSNIPPDPADRLRFY
ncbi:Ig-like domain-containing protein [Acerihabitans arboris]|uniref:Ig-like domain-containing protein n=1 Tax=Acerihabitans arboris TaxID=2691583 RepID=UPI001390AC9B|nr:inverse autotransporter beta domain-containing protein [Acerihabitans arboris]